MIYLRPFNQYNGKQNGFKQVSAKARRAGDKRNNQEDECILNAEDTGGDPWLKHPYWRSFPTTSDPGAISSRAVLID